MSAQTPRSGQRGVYRSPRGESIGFTVQRVEGNLCWSVYDNAPDSSEPFIWRFHDGLNKLHDWPTKSAGAQS